MVGTMIQQMTTERETKMAYVSHIWYIDLWLQVTLKMQEPNKSVLTE